MHHRHWRFPNLTLLSLSLLVAFGILKLGSTETIVETISVLGYFGVFLAGLFFVSTFTIAPAAAVLTLLSQELDPIMIGIVGGAGAMIGDYLAMTFIRDRLMKELNPLLRTLHIYRPINILHSKYFVWLSPVIGAIIIASPLPDEIGLSLLGLTKISTKKFLLLAFILNSIGIFLLSTAVKAALS